MDRREGLDIVRAQIEDVINEDIESQNVNPKGASSGSLKYVTGDREPLWERLVNPSCRSLKATTGSFGVLHEKISGLQYFFREAEPSKTVQVGLTARQERLEASSSPALPELRQNFFLCLDQRQQQVAIEVCCSKPRKIALEPMMLDNEDFIEQPESTSLNMECAEKELACDILIFTKMRETCFEIHGRWKA